MKCRATMLMIKGRVNCKYYDGHSGRHAASGSDFTWATCDAVEKELHRRCMLDPGHAVPHRSGDVTWGLTIEVKAPLCGSRRKLPGPGPCVKPLGHDGTHEYGDYVWLDENTVACGVILDGGYMCIREPGHKTPHIGGAKAAPLCADRYVSDKETLYCKLEPGHAEFHKAGNGFSWADGWGIRDSHIIAQTGRPCDARHYSQQHAMTLHCNLNRGHDGEHHAFNGYVWKDLPGHPAISAGRRANDTQVGGEHYNKLGEFQVWDAWWHWKLNPFQSVILKYVVRYRDKAGIEDLRKATHYIEKLIELEYGTQTK